MNGWDDWLPECSKWSCHQVALQRCVESRCGYLACARHLHFTKERLPRCPMCGGRVMPAVPGR